MIQWVLSEPVWLINQMTSRNMATLNTLLTNDIKLYGQFWIRDKNSFVFITASGEPQSDFTNSIAPLCSKNVGTRSRRYFSSIYIPRGGVIGSQRRFPKASAFGRRLWEFYAGILLFNSKSSVDLRSPCGMSLGGKEASRSCHGIEAACASAIASL